MNNTNMGGRGGAAVRVAPGAADKCTHGAYLGSYECAECVGPLSDAELDMIHRRLAGHEGCVPRCDRAPSGETSRLLATVDATRAEINEAVIVAADMIAKANSDGAHDAARAMRAACAEIVRATTGDSDVSGPHGRMDRSMAKMVATTIESLPLPPLGVPLHPPYCPAPGAEGRVLYKDDRVIVCRVTLEPGAEWPAETHDSDKEYVALVSGALRLFVEYETGIENQWQIDSSAGIPRGCRHTIRNDSATEPAEYISVLRRA